MPGDLPPYSIRRSARARHVRLTISPEGEAVVVLPPRAPLRAAAQLVELHEGWVRRQLARRRQERVRLDDRPALDDGRVLIVNGIPHRVVVVGPGLVAGRAPVTRSLVPAGDGVEGELVVVDRSTGPGVAERLEAWLRDEARSVLGERVAAAAPRLGVRPGQVSVRDQRTRWGSASRDGSLSFSWRLLLAPPFVLDAVVVHELAHLTIAGHSAAFWALVRTHAPRTDESRRWLRTHHRELLAALE